MSSGDEERGEREVKHKKKLCFLCESNWIWVGNLTGGEGQGYQHSKNVREYLKELGVVGVVGGKGFNWEETPVCGDCTGKLGGFVKWKRVAVEGQEEWRELEGKMGKVRAKLGKSLEALDKEVKGIKGIIIGRKQNGRGSETLAGKLREGIEKEVGKWEQWQKETTAKAEKCFCGGGKKDLEETPGKRRLPAKPLTPSTSADELNATLNEGQHSDSDSSNLFQSFNVTRKRRHLTSTPISKVASTAAQARNYRSNLQAKYPKLRLKAIVKLERLTPAAIENAREALKKKKKKVIQKIVYFNGTSSESNGADEISEDDPFTDSSEEEDDYSKLVNPIMKQITGHQALKPWQRKRITELMTKEKFQGGLKFTTKKGGELSYQGVVIKLVDREGSLVCGSRRCRAPREFRTNRVNAYEEIVEHIKIMHLDEDGQARQSSLGEENNKREWEGWMEPGWGCTEKMEEVEKKQQREVLGEKRKNGEGEEQGNKRGRGGKRRISLKEGTPEPAEIQLSEDEVEEEGEMLLDI